MMLPQGWTSKDVVTVTMSLSALGLSVATFYLNNYYERQSVTLRTVSTSMTHTFEANGGKYDPHPMRARFVIVNSGNRDAMILVAHLELESPETHAGGIVAEMNKETPMLIKPREIKLLELETEAGQAIHDQGAGLALYIEGLDASGARFHQTLHVGELTRLTNDLGSSVAALVIGDAEATLVRR